MKNGILILTISVLISSCMTTKTNVGSFRENDGNTYIYAKGKQFWLFWGILPIGRTHVNTPKDGNCQVITRFNLLDAIISGVTCGVITTYTIKIKAKHVDSPTSNNNISISNNQISAGQIQKPSKPEFKIGDKVSFLNLMDKKIAGTITDIRGDMATVECVGSSDKKTKRRIYLKMLTKEE